MTVSDHGRNGVMFTGTEGRIFVNRGTISGKPVEALKDAPLPRDQFTLYPYDNLKRPARMGKLDSIVNHMGNFFDCVKSREQPVASADVESRTVISCHLTNISLRLGRKIRWDPQREEIVGDAQARAMQSREQRKPYAIKA